MITLPTLPEADYSRIVDDPAKAEAGFGSLRTSLGALPLEALEVEARLDGLIASFEVRQSFVNHHAEALEATYIFPLPDRAAVTGFRLEVAGRIIEGELTERGKARKQYDQAIQAGHRAALAEEERPGVFTLRVGNLPPGERARVRLTLAGPMPYRDGEVTFRFPLVVAPRYIPGVPLPTLPVGAGTSPDTTTVPDASRISPPVLLPGFPSPVRLAITVEVAPSPLGLSNIFSSLHTIEEEPPVGGSGSIPRRFRIQPGEKLDRDFVLRYHLGDDRVRSSLLVRPDATGDAGTFLLTVVPPVRSVTRQRPRDLVFVLDRSGSMSGWKMVAARRAVARMVETLTDQDRFTIFAFDTAIETPTGFDGLSLTQATDRRRFQATEFLAGVEDRGGTEMAEPLFQAVEQLNRGDAHRDRILVLITDGQVGNEDQILRHIGERSRGLRIFTLGIDQAVNAGFLRRLADLGGGASEVVESESRLDEVMDAVHRHIGTALLTGLELRGGGIDLSADTLVPGRLPDLFTGCPVLISGRYRGQERGAIVVQATDAEGRPWAAEAQAWRDERAPIGAVWARGRVRELEDRYVIGGTDRTKLEREIVETSLAFGVLSRFTAFVAVDRSEVVNEGGQRKQVVQPVESPAGWGESEALKTQCAPAAGLGAMPMRSLGGYTPAGYSSQVPLEQITRGGTARDIEDELLCESAEGTTLGASPPPSSGKNKSRAAGGGLVGKLFSGGLFRKSDASTSAPEDPHSLLRSQAEALRKVLLGSRGDAATRWSALVALYADLVALLKGLRQANDTNPNVAEMEKVAMQVEQLRSQGQPADSAIQRLHGDLLAALESWLGQATAPSSGAFWK